MDSGSASMVSYHVSCASDAVESKYLKRVQYLRWVRLGLAVILFSIAVSIIACEAVPLKHYQVTSAYGKVGLYLWPMNFDIRPTVALLSCGCVIAFLNLAYTIAALLPSPHAHVTRLNLLAATVAFSGFFAALVGLTFAIYLPGSNPPSGFSTVETIQSWTCKWESVHGQLSPKLDSTVTPPARFARDCALTQASFIMTGLAIGLEILMGVATGVGFWLERSVSKERELDVSPLRKVDVTPKHSGP
ncbi:hypothetical protein BDV28DRAFT_29756 [Aspergillus coremiiformis]|uniref:Membrane-associating domain-containing protein n=1 Tax=Aspergillus coremiiformis TaxID=138285 RepID=A0A5N6Z127_9EURO|nr:hypothetical protein BDV28DRAFT_29756 [Aspergillus coremiiformis]